MRNSHKRWPIVLAFAVMTVVFGANILVVALRGRVGNAPQVQIQNTLPRIEITLTEVSLEEINSGDKDIKYADNVVRIIDGDETMNYATVEIKGRGNSTWGQDKKPYQLKFDQKVDLFGMGKAKKWVLLANYFDDSYMRTEVAFYLERLLGEPYALAGEFVNLAIDGEDLGLYYLTPKVEIGKTRVDLRDPWGILVEVDNLHTEEEHFLVGRNHLQAKDLVAEDNEEEAVEIFAENLERLMSAVKKKDLVAVAAVADLDSMVRYYLLSEFAANPDAYSSSFFMYQDGADDKIHFGPGWDFDFSMGNKQWVWGPDESFYSPYELSIINYYDPDGEGKVSWFVSSAEFQELVGKMYRERLMNKRGELLEYLDEQIARVRTLAQDDAAKWGGFFEEEVGYLREWLRARFDFFDEIYGEMSELADLRVEI